MTRLARAVVPGILTVALAAAAAVLFLFAVVVTWIATSSDARDDEWKALASRLATTESQLRMLA